MTVGRKEDILNHEIEPWKSFEYALREENSSLFNKMIAQYQDNNEYSNALRIEVSESYSAESLFMALICWQHRR
jgi:hypothetical protein